MMPATPPNPAGCGARRGQSGHRGAALLAAMLTVTLVATLAAAALWQQWRSVEIETAERSRLQSSWILTGALDWSRLILREDARSSITSTVVGTGVGGVDHLAEPWATPLAEARLSSFLSADTSSDEDAQQAFLSGQISDAQARLNVLNLASDTPTNRPAQLAFAKLFDLVGVPQPQLATLVDNLRLALSTQAPDPAAAPAPLLPQRVEQLGWLGLPPASLALLKPYITLLPVNFGATTVNLNTASAEVIYASVPLLDLNDAKRVVTQRERSPYRSLAEAVQAVGALKDQLKENQHSVKTSYFEVRGRLRLDDSVLEERSLVQRTGSDVKTLWRERWVGAPLAGSATP